LIKPVATTWLLETAKTKSSTFQLAFLISSISRLEWLGVPEANIRALGDSSNKRLICCSVKCCPSS
jgi:hypothetical protein